MDESGEWLDPLELRIRLDLALEQIAMLKAELAELRGAASSTSPSASGMPTGGATLAATAHPVQAQPRDTSKLRIDQSSPPEAKLALFRDLFAGRTGIVLCQTHGRLCSCQCLKDLADETVPTMLEAKLDQVGCSSV